MKKQTRRQFITTSVSTAVLTTVAGVAVASCATAEGVTAGTVTGETGLINKLSLSELSGPVVAYVRDIDSGEIALCVGEQEIIYSDKEFVNRLLKAIA